MKTIRFEGVDHQFPDEATDEEIAQVLEELSAPAAPTQRMGREAQGAFGMGPDPEPERSALLPSSRKAYEERFSQPAGSIGQSALDMGAVGLAGADDVMGIPKRAVATLRGQKMSDPSANIFRPELEAKKAQIMAQPDLQSPAPMGPEDPALHRPPPEISATVMELAGEIAADPITYAPLIGPLISVFPKLARLLGKGVGVANKGAGRLAEEMSGVSEDALRMASTPEGRAALEASAGKGREIGQELLDNLERADDFMPEKQIRDAAVKEMAPVDLGSTLQRMEGSKGAAVAGRMAPEDEAANRAIDQYLDYIRGGRAPEPGKPVPNLPSQTVSAEDALKIRQKLDAPINWDEPGAAGKSQALKAGRSSIKEELLKRARESGNEEYAKAMESWSSKLDKLDKIKDQLGKTASTRDRRVEQFINNLFGKNSKHKQELMRDLDEIFQSDLTERAKTAQLADQLGPEGKAGWLPRQFTGRSALGYVTGAGAATATGSPAAAAIPALFASPKIASRLTLPMLTKLEEGLKAAGVALTPKAQKAMDALKKPASEAQKARLASILAAELEAQVPANAIPFHIQRAAEVDTTKESPRAKKLRAALDKAKDEKTRARLQAELDRELGNTLSMKGN